MQLLLYDISRLGLQSEAVHLFNNFLDRENRRETEGAAAKQLHLGVLAVGKPGAAKQCREWLLPRRTKAADKRCAYRCVNCMLSELAHYHLRSGKSVCLEGTGGAAASQATCFSSCSAAVISAVGEVNGIKAAERRCR